MTRPGQPRKPSFLWQALLILLPVVILAAVGFYSLRQDKIIAQHDAAERAQTIADSLLPRLWSALTNVSNPEVFEHHAFQIDAAANLLFPPPVPATPAPQPLNPGDLTAKQLALWQQAEQAEGVDTNVHAGVEAVRAFLAAKPPDRFAAIATYNLGVLLEKQDPRGSADTFLSLLDNYPYNIAESGLPLDRLAEFKLLEFSIILTNLLPAKAVISADDFCSRIIFDPSPLTSSFLSWVSAHAQALGLQDGNENWNALWLEYQESRQLYRSARSNLKLGESANSASQGATSPRIFWFNNAGENCLAIRFDEVPASQESRSGSAFDGRDPRFRKTFESSRQIKSKMDLRPESGKNRVTSPNLSHNEPPGFRASPSGNSDYGGGVPQRNIMSSEFSNIALPANKTREIENGTVTLDNEPARVDVSRAKPIFNVSGGTALKNGMSAINVSGSATEQPGVATNPWFLCRSELEVSQELASYLNDKKQVPEYFGIGLEIAGKQLRESALDLRLWRGTGFLEGSHGNRKIYLPLMATNILASAVLSEAGIPELRVNVYLTSPSALFKRQKDRTFWFGSLVAASAFAAFVGLLSAWRAFNRQQELTEMKTNFVSSVSHELRAPIASVRLMAESLDRGKISDPPKQREYFRFIGQECRRLSSLIENVLDFSRIEQGRKQYEFEPTDLLALIKQTVKLMEPYALERQIALQLDLKNLPPATCNLELLLDGRAIQQALINLLDNAIKHSLNGQTVSVTLESSPETAHSNHASRITHHETRDASVVRISVQDNGSGIPPEEHEKIFERFYRLGSELRRETQGVGIGLSIVKHIVEAHQGRILVQSASGQGSRFTIELPSASDGGPSQV